MIGGGNGVAALMFRKVHRSVGDLDELLRRGAVQGIAGNAEAGADIFFAQKRIGGNPSAELAGELAGVLHRGFWHENDEFVAAVARDDVGAAAIRFENLANALENQVAFEVAIEIIDEFEAIQVHKHQREGAAGARGTFPFGRKSFHEEAMRLDARESVGDGLLLSFLERERIVERAGDEVGERAKQQDFFFGEIRGRGGLDVQNAVKLLGVENRQSDGGDGIRQERLQGAVRGRVGTENRHLAVARNVADEAFAKGDALAERAAARARFGLDYNFARGVVERADTDVVVGKSGFQLLGDFREHLVGIQRGDGVARNGVDQGQVTRFGALVVEEPGVFDGDASFAGQHAKQFEVPFIKSSFVIRENSHGANGVVVGNEGNAAETAALSDRLDAELFNFIDVVFANQNGLARSNDVLGDVVSCGADAPGHAIAANDFHLKTKLIVHRIELGDVEIFDVEEAAQLFPNFFGEF